jgi:hypothetical protein
MSSQLSERVMVIIHTVKHHFLIWFKRLIDDLFKKGLHTYMEDWNGKHPIPWDYFNSVNTSSGKNLNWFFNNWFFTNNYIDIAVANVNSNSKKTQTIDHKRRWICDSV